MYNLDNDEICFISIILEQGLDNITKDKEAVIIKKDILNSIFKLEQLDSNKKGLKEKLEKNIEKYDKVFNSYLEEKEEFVRRIFFKLSSMYDIIKEEDNESYEKANYFVTDKPLKDMHENNMSNMLDD